MVDFRTCAEDASISEFEYRDIEWDGADNAKVLKKYRYEIGNELCGV